MTSVDISEWKGASADFDTVLSALKCDGTPETVDFSKMGLGDEKAKMLAKNLTRNITLGKLILKANDLSSAACAHLAKALCTNMRLSYLDLSDNDLGCEGCEEISGALKRNDSLSTLNLSNTNLNVRNGKQVDTSSLVSLSDALRVNRGIVSIDLSSNQITDFGEDESGLESILDAVKYKNRLETLSLADNMIGPRGAQLLARSIAACVSLETLDVSSNHIRPDGAKIIAKQLLGSGSTLRRLIMRNNLLCDNGNNEAGVAEIGNALTENTSLMELDLRENDISATAVNHLIRGMRENATLALLRIDDSDSTHRAMNSLETMGRTNEMISRLHGRGAAHALEVDERGNTVLVAAAASGSYKSLRQFLLLIREQLPSKHAKRAIDKPHSASKKTALMIATERRDGEIVGALLENGADVNKADRLGLAPLHAACIASDLPLACLLIEHGASMSMLSRERKVPIDYNPLRHFAQEVLQRASRKDVILCCSADPMESSFAFWLVERIGSYSNVSVCAFPTADVYVGRRKRGREKVDIRHEDRFKRHAENAGCVIFVFGSVSAESPACKQNLAAARELCQGSLVCVLHDQIDFDDPGSETLQNMLLGVSMVDMTSLAKHVRDVGYNASADLDGPSMGAFRALGARIERGLLTRSAKSKALLVSRVGEGGEMYRLDCLIASERNPYCMIVHNGKHTTQALVIQSELDARGVRVWTPTQVASTRDEYHAKIKRGVVHAHCIIAIWGESSAKDDELHASGGDKRLMLHCALAQSNCIPVISVVLARPRIPLVLDQTLSASLYDAPSVVFSVLERNLDVEASRPDSYYSLGASSDASDFESSRRMRTSGIGFGSNMGELEFGVRTAFAVSAKQCTSSEASEPSRSNEALRNELVSAQSKVEHLEKELASTRAKLNVSRNLVQELFACCKKYHRSYAAIEAAERAHALLAKTDPIKHRILNLSVELDRVVELRRASGGDTVIESSALNGYEQTFDPDLLVSLLRKEIE